MNVKRVVLSTGYRMLFGEVAQRSSKRLFKADTMGTFKILAIMLALTLAACTTPVPDLQPTIAPATLPPGSGRPGHRAAERAAAHA